MPNLPSVTKLRKRLLVEACPEIAAEWHPTRNEGLSVTDFACGSKRKVWWQCSVSPFHEWQTVISNRAVLGHGCPYCRGNRASVTNSVASLHPELVDEWDWERNGELQPEDVPAGSKKSIHWKCAVAPDHTWETNVAERTRKGRGCPYCSGKRASSTNNLALKGPDVAAQWHPTRNGDLTPDKILLGSQRPVWWLCPVSQDHEWEAAPNTRRTGGCPFCAGRRSSITNNLATVRPDLFAQLHPTRNEGLDLTHLKVGASQKVWWICPAGPDHEWEATVASRVAGTGCPCCAGQKLSITNCLATVRPDIAAQWHPTKNAPLTARDVLPGSSKQKYWWVCPVDARHEWPATPNNRSKAGCPFCAGDQVLPSNSLQAHCPDLAAEWHPTLNGNLMPDAVGLQWNRKVTWQCSKDSSHVWDARIAHRTNGSGCPYCSGRRATSANNLAVKAPEIAAEWHPTLNGVLTPHKVTPYSSSAKVFWLCPAGHTWEATPEARAGGMQCPYCPSRWLSPLNNLALKRPDIAAQWHPTLNGDLAPDQVTVSAHVNVWWLCEICGTSWPSAVANRTGKRGTGCPRCRQGWTLAAIRSFVVSLEPHLESMSQAELQAICQQNGLLASHQGKLIARALATGRLTPDQLDDVLSDAGYEQPAAAGAALDTEMNVSDADLDDVVVEQGDVHEPTTAYPTVSVTKALALVDSPFVCSADEEAAQFFIASALAKLWKHAYSLESEAVQQAENYEGGDYATRVRDQFLHEYREARLLPIPPGYDFRIEGELTSPNLMQRHVAVQVRDRRRVGNWSGTGAGKTLSAILASRIVNAGPTVICCPNSVVEGWKEAILGAFPNSRVATKTFKPDWGTAGLTSDPRYLVLNYEAFQQNDSEHKLATFLRDHLIDMIVIDEIHQTKQRTEDISQRRRLVSLLVAAASESSPELHVLGMSATPVVNNLSEGKSLVELVTGLTHDDLKTQATVSNCMALHRRLVTLGTRWMPDYRIGYEQVEIHTDCSPWLPQIRELGSDGSILKLEQILTEARLPVIREHVVPKTLIYSHFIESINHRLREALVADGWRVGFYMGDDKSGLDGFLNGDVDVLIASSAIGTGVDGLQHVCNRLIVNVLPWTAAEFEQLKGRIYRQGQVSEKVTVVLPLTYADVGGERWSWCGAKMHRLEFKRSIADAAVDGVVPEGKLQTQAQAYQSLMGWLARLDAGQVQEVVRRPIVIPLPTEPATERTRRIARFGDFSRMNNLWNRSESRATHQRLQDHPDEWEHYHALYREARETWPVVPFKEFIRWAERRGDLTIGDFGCGEALVAASLHDRHIVHSFDHVAINEQVVACDMAQVPLENESLDVALFSLSLMGSNLIDYLQEAHRCLRLDGHLHVYEATSRLRNRGRFVAALTALGFDIRQEEALGQFTHVWANKSERSPRSVAEFGVG